MRAAKNLTRLGAMVAGLGLMMTAAAGTAEAAAATAKPAEAPLALTARGHEPGWFLMIGAEGLSVSTSAGTVFKARHYERHDMHGAIRIEAAQKGRTLGVTIRHKLCTDTMTGMPFPTSVSLSVAGRHLKGCGGETLTVLEGGWRVIRMGGAPLATPIATFDFARDGKVSGKSGCNRFFGGYKLTAEGLSFEPLGGTRMACLEPEMKVEATFLALAEKVTRVTAGEGRQIRLMAGDHEAFVLERAD